MKIINNIKNLKQYLATKQIKKHELEDPIGDKIRKKVLGLIHRYPDRALLLLSSACHIHCRFCFRKCQFKQKNSFNLDKIYSYLKTNKNITEIIFSGGDPLALSYTFLNKIVFKLLELQNIKIWRFHTRIPVVNPQALSKDLIKLLTKISRSKQLVIVLHINHPNEISDEMITVIKKLQKTGALLLSQTVLLKDINDSFQVLTKLFKNLMQIGIKPYYLHHLDQVQGTDHFRISIKDGKKIYQQLRGNLSGICIPEYVLDLPKGLGKIPVMWLETKDNKQYLTKTFENKLAGYIDPF